jgi:hypothetical protein
MKDIMMKIVAGATMYIISLLGQTSGDIAVYPIKLMFKGYREREINYAKIEKARMEVLEKLKNLSEEERFELLKRLDSLGESDIEILELLTTNKNEK